MSWQDATQAAPNPQTVQALEVVRDMAGTSSWPLLLRCDDGHGYVTKFHCPEKQAAEAVGVALGARLGCPIVEGAIVDVPRHLLTFRQRPEMLLCGATRVAGLCFGSRYIPSARYTTTPSTRTLRHLFGIAGWSRVASKLRARRRRHST